ncbi:MAG: hypothetical protein IJ533_08135 [Prevotella sp.]|nr:hypothetical protein [Prevotella sp.]
MTAVELNAQILRELSYIADNENYLHKTLEFVAKMTKSKTGKLEHGRIYTEMLERLSDFQEYEQGWDGEDACPLNHHVVKNFKKLLKKSNDTELEGWTIYPAANGTLLLQNKIRKSGINIGIDGYSYYSISEGEAKGENNLKFSPQAVLNTMKCL